MAKQQVEDCIFCDANPCECNGPAPEKKVTRKRKPKPKPEVPAPEGSSPPTSSPQRFIRGNIDTDAVTVTPEEAYANLLFSGILHPDEHARAVEKIKSSPKGDLLKFV